MKEWLQSYGYLLIVLAAVIVLFLVVFYFAVKAYSKHAASFKAEEAEIKRLTALKEKFRNFDETTLKNAEDEEILEGVALIYQLSLQRCENMEEEFLKMREEQQSVYVLDVFVSDGCTKVFFSENSDILRSRIVPALKLIGMDEESERIEKIRRMYDDYDVEASYNEKVIEETDKFIENEDILRKIKLKGAEYIKENVSLLKF